MDLEEYLLTKFARTIRAWPPDVVRDIYALSLYRDDNNVPYRPAVYLLYNTRSHAAAQNTTVGEARWNIAYWPWEQLTGIEMTRSSGTQRTDSEGTAALDAWLREAVDAGEDDLIPTFAALCVRIARRLHGTGVMRETFGRDIPIVMHDDEWDEALYRNTEAANPPGVANEFLEAEVKPSGAARSPRPLRAPLAGAQRGKMPVRVPHAAQRTLETTRSARLLRGADRAASFAAVAGRAGIAGVGNLAARRSHSVTTILPWAWRPACSATASRICSIGKVAAIGTVILPARIASVSCSRASGWASLPPVARTPPGGLGPAATVEIRTGGTPSASAASPVSVPKRSVAAVTSSRASARAQDQLFERGGLLTRRVRKALVVTLLSEYLPA